MKTIKARVAALNKIGKIKVHFDQRTRLIRLFNEGQVIGKAVVWMDGSKMEVVNQIGAAQVGTLIDWEQLGNYMKALTWFDAYSKEK